MEVRMPDTPPMGLEEDLDDAKAIFLLCGNADERRRAGYYFYEKYHELIMNCVRAKFRSLPSDLAADAVHQAFIEFTETAATDREFDQEHPQCFILTVALRRACDLFRKRTHRGRFKEECIEEIAAALDGTRTGRDWSDSVYAGGARELQELFHRELDQCGERQRKIGRLMVDRCDRSVTDAELAELYRETYGEPITVPAAKRAREEVRKKLRDILDKRTRPTK